MPNERPDLGALTHQISQEILRRESPILAAHGLQIWDYMVLTSLLDHAAPTQAQLARRVGRDSTRLIATLDRLVAADLVKRAIDPVDRRNHVVSLTPVGRAKVEQCRREIRSMEEQLLQRLPERRRATLARDLQRVIDGLAELQEA